MVSPGRLAAFAVPSFLLVIVPGPGVLFVIGRAPAHGRRAAPTTVAATTLGAYLLVVAVAFGVGPVVERSVLVFTALKLAGAAYLVHLGVKAWRRRGSLRAAVAESGPARGGPRTLGEGFALGVAHPETMVFFAAVLPRFVDREQGHVPARMPLPGLVLNAIAVVSDAVWGLAASAARDWFARSPRRLSAVGGTGGLTMIGPGVTVALTGQGDRGRADAPVPAHPRVSRRSAARPKSRRDADFNGPSKARGRKRTPRSSRHTTRLRSPGPGRTSISAQPRTSRPRFSRRHRPGASSAGGRHTVTSITSSTASGPNPDRATKRVPSWVGGGVSTLIRVSGTASAWRGQSVSRRHASSGGSGTVRSKEKVGTARS
ncbi:hypothetical protein SCANM63S_06136 [Streptomyces canarius]